MPIFAFFAAITTVVVVLFLPYQGFYSKEWDMVAHDCVSSTYVEFDCFAYFTFVKTTHFLQIRVFVPNGCATERDCL